METKEIEYRDPELDGNPAIQPDISARIKTREIGTVSLNSFFLRKVNKSITAPGAAPSPTFSYDPAGIINRIIFSPWKDNDCKREYPARFELWFVPEEGEEGEDGSGERLLATVERRIYGWER